ncbi:hypothetical protein ScPMuIL_006538 [Solemya velum]
MLVDRYRPILYLQYFLLLEDLFMNSFIEMLRFKNVILLVLFVIQDVCIIFSVIVVFLLFFNTFIFQAGLVNVLVNKFKMPISVTFIYFGLCVGLHVWEMTLRWADPAVYIWSTSGFSVLYIIQRTSAVFYYYFYKRTALKLGDARFYQDSEWIRREFEKRSYPALKPKEKTMNSVDSELIGKQGGDVDLCQDQHFEEPCKLGPSELDDMNIAEEHLSKLSPEPLPENPSVPMKLEIPDRSMDDIYYLGTLFQLDDPEEDWYEDTDDESDSYSDPESDDDVIGYVNFGQYIQRVSRVDIDTETQEL